MGADELKRQLPEVRPTSVMRAGGVALAAALALAPVAEAAQLTVNVTNVRKAKGHIRVAVCSPRTFLADSCEFEMMAPATVGVTTVVFPDIPPGVYAAQVFQDEHDDGVVHRNLIGIPTEGVGFSNDAPLHLKGPRFREAAFEVGDQPVEIRLRLRHLMP